MKNLKHQLNEMSILMKRMGVIKEAFVGNDGSFKMSSPTDDPATLVETLLEISQSGTNRKGVSMVMKLSGVMESQEFGHWFDDSQKVPQIELSQHQMGDKSQELVKDVINSLFYQQGGKRDHQISTAQILSLINYDIQLIQKEQALEKELEDLEELLVGALGDSIVLRKIDKRTYDRLMDPNADLESLNAPHDENPVDDEGSLTGGDVHLDQPGINHSLFQQFVEKNPEYQPHYKKWSDLNTAHVEAMLAEKKAHAIFGLEHYQNAFQDVKKNAVTATLENKALNDGRLFDSTAAWVVKAYFAAKANGSNPQLVSAVDQLVGA